MAETDVHRQAMTDLIETLAEFFREQPDVYVAGNLLLYYEEENPWVSIAPDVFVVKGVPKKQRRIYQLWQEKQPPAVVWEITSRSTRLEDFGNKRALYAMIGVQEYFLFDPLGEYLSPPLQGFILVDDEYQRMLPTADGSFLSQALGLKLRLEDEQLRLVDAASEELLLRPAEVAEAYRVESRARRDAQKRATAEAEARYATERRLTNVEAELARLRAELARLRSDNASDNPCNH